MIVLNEETMRDFQNHLEERELSRSTIANYMHTVRTLAAHAEGRVQEKRQLIAFKQDLLEKGYAHTSVNTMLAAVNCLLRFLRHTEWSLLYLKLQKNLYADQKKELTKYEYQRLVETAAKNGDERLSMLIQTICALGIRISELKSITHESVVKREAVIRLKAKTRVVLIPGKLTKKLLAYCKGRGIRSGPIFITRSGQPMDRSNIWKALKCLARKADVTAEKVFPHNFRHLFARTYYSRYKDIVCLADILGHSNVNTTRIYTNWDFREQKKRMEELLLVM